MRVALRRETRITAATMIALAGVTGLESRSLRNRADGISIRRGCTRSSDSVRFASFSQASAECADSRLLVGFHYRYATDAGRTLGRHVARFLFAHHLRPWWSRRRSHR